MAAAAAYRERNALPCEQKHVPVTKILLVASTATGATLQSNQLQMQSGVCRHTAGGHGQRGVLAAHRQPGAAARPAGYVALTGSDLY